MEIKKYMSSDEKIALANLNPGAKKIFIETYGCQMNVADSELVYSIMIEDGFAVTDDYNIADLILINTCSVRDNAEQKIRNRLKVLGLVKRSRPGVLIGILGCMAERLKEQLIEEEKLVDIIAGPDSYRALPKLVAEAESGQKAINVLLSREETYAEISPVRKSKNKVTAFVSITRGCDNMCAFCVVPFTRGRERSRNPETILREVDEIISEGFKEITLLGQNVDKYNWNNGEVNFAGLLRMVAIKNPNLRVRFSTSYPQDFTDEVIKVMSEHENICKYIHLPVQAGSNNMLEKMRRGYTREWYLGRIKAIKTMIPDCAISTDIIAGYCSETEEDHKETLSLMEEVGYDYAYMFKYSPRPGTYAANNFPDDVSEEDKSRRLSEIIEIQHKLSLESNLKDLNKIFSVLVEGISKKSDERLFGRNSQNKVIVFPGKDFRIGTYVNVLVTDCTSATLLGHITSEDDLISKINKKI